jgi:signal transduction histidine kinase/ligand-binding sensor domain-containing protein
MSLCAFLRRLDSANALAAIRRTLVLALMGPKASALNPDWAARNVREGRRAGAQQYAWGVCLLLAMAPAPIFGDASDRTISQFVHTAWTAKDGVPANIVDIAQTADGFLWLGTPIGLYRFDGVTFELYQPESGPAFPSNRINALQALNNGDLWIGFLGGGASMLHNGRCTNYPSGDGLPPGNILTFAQDQDGTIWAGTDAALARFVDGQWQRAAGDWGYPYGGVQTMYVDHRGTLWVASRDSIAFLPHGARKFQTTGIKVGQVPRFAEAPSGTLWMAETTRSVRPIPLPENTHGLEPEIQVGSVSMLFDDDGSLWTTSIGDGLRRVPFPDQLNGRKISEFSPAAESFTEKDGLTSDFSGRILKDREGSIWVVTQAGLDRFRKGPLVPLVLPGKFGEKALFPGDGGDIWVSSQGGEARTDGHTWQYTEFRNYFNHGVRDSRGVTWLDTLSSGPTRLFRMEKGKETPVVRMPSESENLGQVLAEDRMDTLWLAGGPHQVFFLKNGRWGELETPPEIAGKIAISAFTDDSGRIWFGFRGAIMMLDGRNLRAFTSKDGVPNLAITCFTELGGHIWIGGPRGLALFEGNRFRTIASAGGDWLEGISGVDRDSNGDLFVTEIRGVAFIPAAEISKVLENPAARVQVQIFDWRDGLASTTGSRAPYPDSLRGLDGRIWFSTSSGVAWIDPAHIAKNLLPPPVAIRSITADGKRLGSAAGLQLPPHTGQLLIDYTALSLAVPERVHFRYKLEGYDKDWQTAGSGGTQREATYTNLSPRKYRFRVIACNNDGVWNETGASLDFSILPAWYQTLWFRSICVVAFALLLWMLYRLRLRQMERLYIARMQERVGERTRIARELHDTLLQSFQGLLMVFQAASNLLPHRPDDAKKKLDGAIEKTSQALNEGRGAVQGLRSAAAIGSDLAVALRTLGDELATGGDDRKSSAFEVMVEGEPKNLKPVVRDEVYRIAGEALRNAFAHAEANRIEVEIHFDALRLRLRIRDDGKGIDFDLLGDEGRPGHWGLQGMRERAKVIGGKLEIWSSAQSGTEVELTLRSSVAYDAGTLQRTSERS